MADEKIHVLNCIPLAVAQVADGDVECDKQTHTHTIDRPCMCAPLLLLYTNRYTTCTIRTILMIQANK